MAAYLAQKCIEQNVVYNNTKIQKLLYCAYGIYLAKGFWRICDEYPRAWDYGPVFPKVFKYIYSGNEIAHYSNIVMQIEKSESQIIKVIDLTIDTFGKYRANQLSAWTHRPGSPWDKTVHGDASNEGAGLYGFIPD
ncbi:MAG: DUF4065 domain-containing protein [Desulfovibrionaceae bacterium]|nr:DUF4065 domain-containing protein [Desulfovibrionaceae bacterium]